MIGSRLGPYEIVSTLGSGGMGDVYRARDAKLNRDVAIKALPATFASDADRVARFEREAQVLASLNHPNIGAIYGIESGALVLELVEGDTLAELVARGPLSHDDALPIARQIADALAAAHESGIVHRDLKPANIKVRADGTVKVLDFGLAKLVEGPAKAGHHEGLSQSPTITTPAMTQVGVILGTAAYMSPEQAKGREADRRTDLWAFGCVLFEMLTGRRAFPGEDVSDTLAAIIRGEPDWALLPRDTAASIKRLLRRCLTKDVRARISDASTARIEIDEALSASRVEEVIGSSPPSGRERIVMRAALAVLTVVAAVAIVWGLRRSAGASELRLDIATPPTTDPISLAMSPDGRTMAYVATSDGRPQLWVRAIDALDAKLLPGTEGARYPFWSPEGQSIAFFADQRLKRIDLNGGRIRVLARAFSGGGGSWGTDGTILFNPNSGIEPVWKTTAAGGDAVAVTKVASPQQSAHRMPQFLPDGRHFLYFVAGTPEVSGVYVGAIDGSMTKRLLDAQSHAVYYPSGYLLFVQQQTLFAQPFDSERLSLSGQVVPIADHVAVGATAAFAASGDRIVLRRGSGGGRRRQLAWFDRSGKELDAVGPPETNGSAPSLSIDGSRIAIHRSVSGNTDIWLLERNLLTRLVSSPGLDAMALWSPDGKTVVFTSGRRGAGDLFVKRLSGTADEELLIASSEPKLATDWSRDGQFLLYGSQSVKSGYDVFALPMKGGKTPIAIARTDADERLAQFSPDGKWVAYQSNDTGRDEIYVQTFPAADIRQRVSTEGGGYVRWRRDGKELFYVTPEGRLMAVPITFDRTGPNIQIGTPATLFLTSLGAEAVSVAITRQSYEVAPDGQRFLINTVIDEVVATPISIILNWKP